MQGPAAHCAVAPSCCRARAGSGALRGVDLFAGLIVGQIAAYRPHLPVIAMALFNLDAAPANGKCNDHDPHSGPGDKCREL